MIFDKEYWPIAADPEGKCMYGTIMKNSVRVLPEVGGRYTVYIRAPGGILTLIHSLVDKTPKEFVDGLVAKPISFYLDEHDGHWIFGAKAFGEFYDLWTYRDLPFWGKA